MPSSICKCDKPLEPLSIYPTYSNSFYPLHLFLPFHTYPNLPIHKYPSSIFVDHSTNISPVFLPLTLLLSLLSYFLSYFQSFPLPLPLSVSLPLVLPLSSTLLSPALLPPSPSRFPLYLRLCLFSRSLYLSSLSLLSLPLHLSFSALSLLLYVFR